MKTKRAIATLASYKKAWELLNASEKERKRGYRLWEALTLKEYKSIKIAIEKFIKDRKP